MAYFNSYANQQWPALQSPSWPESGPVWGNSIATVGVSSDCSRSSSTFSPIDLANSNPASHNLGSRAQQIAANIPSVVNSAYFSNPSEASAATYLPATTDDPYYLYFGDMTGCDVGAVSSPSLASSETMRGDHESRYEMPSDSQKEDTSGRKKTSRRTLQNRLAQRAFRERQAKAQEELYNQVTRLKTQYENLESMYMQLREHHEHCGQAVGTQRDFSRRLT